MIAIIDYGVGNLGSVKNAFDYLKIPAKITSSKKEILEADKIVLPGVGAFRDAIDAFRSMGFEEVLKECVRKNKPILGICVGMQMLFECSYEHGYHKGLGLLEGNIVRFDDSKAKVPQIGWNQINLTKESPLLKGVANSYVYFVHSYHVDKSAYAIATSSYADTIFPCAIQKGNVYATQFHPEKSGEVGLKILKNFGDVE